MTGEFMIDGELGVCMCRWDGGVGGIGGWGCGCGGGGGGGGGGVVWWGSWVVVFCVVGNVEWLGIP